MAWLGLVVAATVGLTWQSYVPGGEQGQIKWPTGTSLRLDSSRPTLVLFVHPKCACSDASLDGLEQLLAVVGDRAAVHVYFFQPRASHEEWLHAPLRRQAEAIAGIVVHTDWDGAEAERFGAVTSGYVMLFGPEGVRVFGGGITAARGHFGPSAGQDALSNWIQGKPDLSAVPVFGCKLTKLAGDKVEPGRTQ